MNYSIPEHITEKNEIFKYLKDNKSLIERQKKSAIKKADSICVSIPLIDDFKQFETKEIGVTSDNAPMGKLLIKLIGNTTNIMDSHDDVHIDGLWRKTLRENKYILHLQEHEMEFEKIISDVTNVSTSQVSFKSLGFNYEGTTQALIMTSEAPLDRNTYMCDQYLKGYVKNHSVGMQYVNYVTCINSKESYFAEEKANWDKYYPIIANKSVAEDKGYFFAVLEAKLIEISAVPIGSNRVTPTQSVREEKGIIEADVITSTTIEPVITTQKETQKQNFSQIKFI